MSRIYVIHENDAWVEPLRAAFKESELPFDEWFIVLAGSYVLVANGEEVHVNAGQEYVISRGTKISGRVTAGTRTIHAFGGRRAERIAQPLESS